MTSLNVYSKEQTDNLLLKKEDKLTFDNEPKEGSTNPVTSDGIYMSLEDIKAQISTGYIHYGYLPPENPNIGMFWYNNTEGKLYICVGVVEGVGRWNLIVTSEGGATWGNIQGDVSNQLDLMTLFEGKQDKLTAGTGIAISGNEISSTVPVITVDSVADTTSENPLQNKVITQQLNNLNERKQEKLTAGDNITIDANNVISATLADSYTKEETDSLLAQKQNNLTQTQLSAVNSGIDATKVSTYDSYENTKQAKLTAGTGINITANNVISATGQIDAYTKSETDSLLSQKQNSLNSTQMNAVNSGINASKVSTYDGYSTGKQDKLTAGTNITIENNVISASGGGSYSAGDGIVINNNTISARVTNGLGFQQGFITPNLGNGIELSNSQIRAKLGDGLQFDSNGAIEVVGGSSDGVKTIQQVSPDSNGDIRLAFGMDGNSSPVCELGQTPLRLPMWMPEILECTFAVDADANSSTGQITFGRTYTKTPLLFFMTLDATTRDYGVHVKSITTRGATLHSASNFNTSGSSTIYCMVIPRE